MPPLVAWERSFQDDDGCYVLPAAPMDRATVRRDFYPFKYRRMQRTGVQFARSRYWNPALAPLIHPERMVRVHYHPDNPSCVWVRGEDNVLIEATVVAGVALGEGLRVKLSEAEEARLDAIKLQGYDRGDAIRERAERRKRQHAKTTASGLQRSHQGRSRKASLSSTSARPPVPLSRVSVHVEVLDS